MLSYAILYIFLFIFKFVLLVIAEIILRSYGHLRFRVGIVLRNYEETGININKIFSYPVCSRIHVDKRGMKLKRK